MAITVSFSGLGGSGKSTQINKLRNFFSDSGFKVSVVALREKFLWPRIANALKKKDGGSDIDKADAKKYSLVKYFIRHLFYFFDFWRVYLFCILPKTFNSDVVLVDRVFLDFIIELDFSFGRITKLSRILFKFLPLFDLSLFFDISPENSYKRKIESSLDNVGAQYNIYKEAIIILGNNRWLKVEAIDDVNDIFFTLKNLFLEILRSGVVAIKHRLFNYFLFPQSSLVECAVVEKIIIWNKEEFFTYAKLNRFLWRVLPDLLGYDKQSSELLKLEKSGTEIVGKKENTINQIFEILKDVKCDWRLVKESDVEISQDVDLLCLNIEDYKQVQLLLRNGFDGKIEEISKIKSDLKPQKDSFLPIDLHCGYTFYSRKYFDDSVFVNSSLEASILSVISHSVAEMTVITLGDVIKVREIIDKNTIDWDVIFNQARKYGWLGLCQRWLLVCVASEDYRFPYFLSIYELLLDKVVNINVKGFYNLLRALRARRMGQVPFHPFWGK